VITIRLEDIQSALSQWARNEVELKDRVRLLEDRVDELTMIIKHGVEQVQSGFGLANNVNATLQLVIEEALLAVTTRADESVRTIAAQKDEIERLQAKIGGLEAEARESIDRITKELELPLNPHRTLRNATTEACEMVTEAKKMVRENL